jgi:hypothetical protein
VADDRSILYNPHMSAPPDVVPYQLRQFKPSFEAVGILIDFLTRKPPFDRFAAGALVTTLKYQVTNGFHVAAFRGETLVGYCGWLRIMAGDGEHWVRERGDLRPAANERADAVALDIVRVDEPQAVRPLIRACRRLEAGKRVFFKRDYLDATHASRRNTVMNVPSAGQGEGVRAARP